MSETLFISDLHLDNVRPHIIDLFIGFLHGRARGADALYILGDLYEYWIGDDDPAEALQPTIEALAALNRRGVATYFMHGNRDFLIDREFAKRSGCKLLSEAVVIDLYGEPTLIMHGDTLCTDDLTYQKFRARIRNPITRCVLLSLSMNMRRTIARWLRAHSQRAIGDKTAEIMDVSPRAVERAMKKHGVRRLIHGHTHRPAIHEFEIDGVPATRIVLGDWYEQGSVLRCTPSGCQFAQIDP